MSKRLFLYAAAGLALLPASAPAGVQVLGTSYARSCYEAAERVAPEGATAGASYAKDALRTCDKAFAEEALSGNDAVATHVNRGILRMKAGDVAGALADYDAALAKDPTEPEAWLNKGVAIARGDAWAQALPFFTKAIEHHTSRPALAYFARAMAYEDMGDVRAAYYDYKQANTLEPEWKRPVEELSRFRVVGQ